MLVRRQRDGEEAASPGKQHVLGAHFGTGAARLPRSFKLGSLVLGLQRGGDTGSPCKSRIAPSVAHRSPSTKQRPGVRD